MDIVDELVHLRGCYTGRGWFAPSERPPRVARLEIAELPGGSGVLVAYEVISFEGEIKHRERSMVVRSTEGETLLLVAFEGDNRSRLLHEIEPGLFAERQSEPYRKGQMAIRIERRDHDLHHAYCWADASGVFAEVDVAEFRLAT